jgi:hypothetical protein
MRTIKMKIVSSIKRVAKACFITLLNRSPFCFTWDKKVVAVMPRPELKPFFDLQYEGLSNYDCTGDPEGH